VVQCWLDKFFKFVFFRAMQECQNEANGGKFRLRDLLSVPMQRVLKYPLLLRVIIGRSKALSRYRFTIRLHFVVVFLSVVGSFSSCELKTLLELRFRLSLCTWHSHRLKLS